MKYSSFAIVAALFAAGTLASSSLTLAADKPALAQTASIAMSAQPKQSAELYAQAPAFNDAGSTRLDGQMLGRPAAVKAEPQPADDQPGFNLLALLVAGLAVMGSLAFRRAPNK